MDLEMLSRLGADALMTAWDVSYPVLLAALIVGLVVSIFQAVTQIQEMTLTFIPKILAAALAVALSYDAIVQAMLQFTKRMFTEWGSFLPK